MELTETTIKIEQLDFNYNWNKKLLCDCLTTLRLRNDDRYKLGKRFELILFPDKAHCQNFGEAYVEDIKHLKISTINEFIARLDTGYTKEKCVGITKTMYKNKNINWEHQELSLILLVKVK